MSWFTDFLTDTARQAAPGIHQGINDDQKKRRDLEAMRQTIPILVEQQQALQPGRLEELRAKDESDTRRALLVAAMRNQPRAPQTHVVGGRLVGDQGNVLYEPPPAQPTQAEQLMSRILGPLGSSTQESPVASGPGVGAPQKPASFPEGMSITSGGVTLRGPGYPIDRLPISEYGRRSIDFERLADEQGLKGQERADFIADRMAGYRGKQAFVSGQEGTVGRSTGPAATASTALAEKKAAASAAGNIRGKLLPVESGEPGRMVSGVQAIGEAGARGGDIPAAERVRLSELYTLKNSIGEIRRLTDNFQKDWFGPVRGGMYAPFAERVTGGLSPDEVKARRLMYDAADMLLRARSGAQINEQEYKRLSRLLPTPDLPAATAVARMDDFERQLDIITANRVMLQRTPASQVAPAPGTVAPERTTPSVSTPRETKTINGKTYIKQNGRWYEQ